MDKREKSQSNTKEQPNTSTGLVISNNNLFVEKLNSLKEFSGQLPKETNLPTVASEGGLFGWFDHTVTGDELNHLTKKIQVIIIEQNKTVVKVVQEIATIYDTFSALDKVYVQEILIAINTAFRAIDEVKATNERISEQQKDITANQQDIKQVINQQKQIIQALKNFKEKLEKLKHLYDIDKTFDEVNILQSKIETLERASDEQKHRIKAEIEQIVSDADKQYETLKNELTVLRNETRTLLFTKSISIASMILSALLFILFVTGVLR